MIYLSPFRQILGYNLKLEHGHFLLHPLLFIRLLEIIVAMWLFDKPLLLLIAD